MKRKLYTPKKNIKAVVLELIDIVNNLAWQQSYRNLSGGNYYRGIGSKLNELTLEMKRWGTPKKR
jgi:hypothetical protein